jgi:serine/threonine protein kinase
MPTPRLTVSGEERTRLASTRLGQLVLDKWRLDRLIGVGGMAAVFEATQRNGSKVAIKILHPDLASFDDIRERFLAEGYAANRVAHPGVVTVREEGTTADGAVFLVMDLLRGQTLAERIEARADALPLSEVLELASQLLDVLVQAHARGIVHRDIKPENVFLTSDGRARLLDFGIARVETAVQTHASAAGTTLGTPAFMPPEQALGRWQNLDGRSDLWSLGATLYLLLSGKPVRERGSATEQLLGAMTQPVASLGNVTQLPRSVIAVVDRALAYHREDRFPDARSMQLAVRALLDEIGAPDSRAALGPASLSPVALSLSTSGSALRGKRSSASIVRPVSASATPLPSSRPQPSALPLYVTLGFAVGIGIVVAARLTVHTAAQAAVAAAAAHGAEVSIQREPLAPVTHASAPAATAAAAVASSASSARELRKRAPKPPRGSKLRN